MGRTTPGSPSISVLPPVEGVIMSESSTGVTNLSEGGVRNGCFIRYSGFSSGVVLQVDTTTHRLDAGPIRLTTIAHELNYRMAVLRDGAKSAACVGRSRRAEGRILEDAAVPSVHQLAVMFQIVSALALEVPAFLRGIAGLRGMSPDVQLSCEPWGHMDHTGAGCECCSSDRKRGKHILQRNAGDRDRCPLYPIDQVLMAVSCSWCMYDGKRACWWPVISCGP